LSYQHPRLHQRPYALLQKEGIALRAGDEELFEGHQAGVVPEQGMQQLVGTHWRQRVQAQLCVIGLAAPAVPVLGTIVDQQQEAGRRQALDEIIEQSLCL